MLVLHLRFQYCLLHPQSAIWARLLIFTKNSLSFRVFSHSKGLRAELPSDSLWFSGADLSWGARRFHGRFHQGFPPNLKGAARFHQFFKFRGVSGSLPNGSAEGSTKVAPRFHQGSTKIAQVSWCLWSSGAVRLGCQKVLWKVPPSLF